MRAKPSRPVANAPDPLFLHYVGIDYSGAATTTSSLPGLRIFHAIANDAPAEVPAPAGAKKYWTRKGLAHWLLDFLVGRPRTIVGIDHGFSFPIDYFDQHHLAHDWSRFLDDFHKHWPTDGDNVYVDFVRDGALGIAHLRGGRTTWRRLTEQRSRSAKSVFHFDAQGSVAKSTHTGLPWLRFLRARAPETVRFWPFDTWTPAPGESIIAEVYPRLCRDQLAPAPDTPAGLTPDQHDAWAVARWIQQSDLEGTLAQQFCPSLTNEEKARAAIEGWILGVR